MTKIEVYEDMRARRRQDRADERYNAYLAYRLASKTHEETVQELLAGLTVVVGMGNARTENAEATLVF